MTDYLTSRTEDLTAEANTAMRALSAAFGGHGQTRAAVGMWAVLFRHGTMVLKLGASDGGCDDPETESLEVARDAQAFMVRHGAVRATGKTREFEVSGVRTRLGMDKDVTFVNMHGDFDTAAHMLCTFVADDYGCGNRVNLGMGARYRREKDAEANAIVAVLRLSPTDSALG